MTDRYFIRQMTHDLVKIAINDDIFWKVSHDFYIHIKYLNFTEESLKSPASQHAIMMNVRRVYRDAVAVPCGFSTSSKIDGRECEAA